MDNDLLAAFANYRGLRRNSRLWTAVALLLCLPCLGAIKVRESALADADFLGGREEIKHFLSINVWCLVLAAVILAAEILLFFLFCVGKRNTGMKILAFIGGTAAAAATAVMFTFSVRNIRSDLKSTTHAEPNEYVLSTSGGEYFLGFHDGGEYAQMPIRKKLYDELSEGEENTGDYHSVIYDMVTEAGYGDVTEYKGGIEIDYYFHCSMIESAKLKQ